MISEAAESALPRGPVFFDALERHFAVAVRGLLPAAEASAWARAVLAARAEWNADFGGEQWSLGRAFYTHLETERAREYFREAAASDAIVERVLPGMQARVRGLLATFVAGRVVPRPGWCGPGVHVFLPEGEVAEHGGVVHQDHEGLTRAQLSRGARALSLVLMLAPPQSGGGLRLFAAKSEEEADEEESVVVEYGQGDLVVFDSYRVHQIEPFAGDAPRVSVTLHSVEVSEGVWESWF